VEDIWGSSIVRSFLEKKQAALSRDDNLFVVLGDSEYPLQPWLIKPYDDPVTDAEIQFNIEHKALVLKLNDKFAFGNNVFVV